MSDRAWFWFRIVAGFIIGSVIGVGILSVIDRCEVYELPADPYGYWVLNFVVACH